MSNRPVLRYPSQDQHQSCRRAPQKLLTVFMVSRTFEKLFVATTYINAGIKVHVRAVLIRTTETILRAKRIALLRTKIIDLDDDAVASIAQTLAGRTGLNGKPPASAAGRTLTSALSRLSVLPLNLCDYKHAYRADAIEILGDSSRKAWLGIEEASSSLSLAIWATECVTSAVLSEGRLVGDAITWPRGRL